MIYITKNQFHVNSTDPDDSRSAMEIVKSLVVERYPGAKNISGGEFSLSWDGEDGYRLDVLREPLVSYSEETL